MTCPRPTILVLTLGGSQFGDMSVDDNLTATNAMLTTSALIKRARTKDGALKSLVPPPQGIYIMNADILNDEYRDLSFALVKYVKNGGTVVYGGIFSSMASPPIVDSMFREVWDLNWTYGNYHRTVFALNPCASGVQRYGETKALEVLESSYSQKALHLAKVDPEDRWYSPTAESRLQSHVWAPTPVTNHDETPVAFRSIGKGWMGFTGDVNNEAGTVKVVLRMFKLI